MKRRHMVVILALLFTLLFSGLPALAQLGVGFGAWNWGGNQGGLGTWFGVSLWPNHRRSAQPPASRLETVKQANGYLEGNLMVRVVCPPSQASSVACPVTPESLANITISAQPYGASQWFASRPDSSGHYRLALPPGGYNISVRHPTLNNSDKVLRQIIIQPGQTNWQDLQIDLPAQ